ncbi:MAG: OmpA family protein [Bacteroidia bacterium]|nr:OmpA family protein [Bacteroidia bacterium]
MKNPIKILLPVCLILVNNILYSQDNKDLKVYNNYDFIPGEKVLFEDDLHDALNGEFPQRWKLISGQGVINSNENEKYFLFYDCSWGNIGKIEPRIKTKSYLGNAFTLEFDFNIPTEEVVSLIFKLSDDDEKFISIEPSNGILKPNYFAEGLEGKIPDAEKLINKWHHAAFAFKNKQIKCYIDQHRVLVIPDCEFDPIKLYMGGSLNVKIKNFKLADGGGMNMLNKILTDGKFVSHAIKFDVGKSTIKGESMGFINELGKWLKENPTIKLEIGGHTDSDGDDASNLKLSEQRAEAVRKLLVSLGVDGSRLKSKGYGESKPSSSNDTSEGKADNRRVEFIKI